MTVRSRLFANEMTRVERGLCFPTHVVRCAVAIHPIDEDLSMGTPEDGALDFVGIGLCLRFRIPKEVYAFTLFLGGFGTFSVSVG
jgi:hypothetical protein